MCNTQQPFQSWHKIAKLKRYHKEHQAHLRSLVNKLDWSPEVVRLWLYAQPSACCRSIADKNRGNATARGSTASSSSQPYPVPVTGGHLTAILEQPIPGGRLPAVPEKNPQGGNQPTGITDKSFCNTSSETCDSTSNYIQQESRISRIGMCVRAHSREMMLLFLSHP